MRIGDLGARPIVPVAVHIHPWIEALARLGLAAKGIVYLLVGMIAARAALLHRGGPKNQAGALVEILHQPLGTALLTAIGVGLAAYVAWRTVSGWRGSGIRCGASSRGRPRRGRHRARRPA